MGYYYRLKPQKEKGGIEDSFAICGPYVTYTASYVITEKGKTLYPALTAHSRH